MYATQRWVDKNKDENEAEEEKKTDHEKNFYFISNIGWFSYLFSNSVTSVPIDL